MGILFLSQYFCVLELGVDLYVEAGGGGVAQARSGRKAKCEGEVPLAGIQVKVLKHKVSEMPSSISRPCFNKFYTLTFFWNEPVFAAISR